MNSKEKMELKRKIDFADVVSFDMFDTLLFRKCVRVEDIWEEVGFLIKEKDFARNRKKAQIQASREVKKREGKPHAELKEIYQKLKETDPKIKNNKKKIKKLIQLEINTERKELIPNCVMKEIYHYAINQNKRIIVVTDMYLPKKVIAYLLKECGYNKINEIYVSSEERKTKYQGDIFEKVIKQENCIAERIIHIGDSIHSDVKQAKKYGIHTFFYKDGRNDKEYSLYTLAKTNSIITKDESFWYSIGYQVGGPFYLFLYQWIKQIVGKRKCFLIARDGYVLYQIFQKLECFNFEYLYLSRRALLLAAITKLDKDTLEHMPPYSCGQSIQQVLDYLNFNDIKEEEFIRKGFPSLKYVIRSQQDKKKIKEVFRKYEKQILQKCEEERKAFLIYLCKKVDFETEQIYFDAGWSGNSQKMLEQVLENCKIARKDIFLYAGIKKDYKSITALEGKRYVHLLFDHLKSKDRKNLECATAVLELFFSAPTPSLHRYKEEELEFESDSRNNEIAILNQGIFDYVIEHKDMKVTEQYATRELIRMISHPTRREAQKIGKIKNEDIFSSNKERPKYMAYLTMEYFLQNPRTEVFWPQGIYRNPDNCFCIKILIFIRQQMLMIKNGIRNSEARRNEKKRTK